MNHLAGSTSPYLLQHANNPVDWYPWGSEALEKARREDKPIFLSIGYAACHWCHVMAHESFEDAHVAAYMNEHFVNIKVDREERPDLDGIYMSAVTALTGQGGWPMSVFLNPADMRPFYAGTYFPPVPRHGLPAFLDLLKAMADTWVSQQEEIKRVGAEVAAHLTAEPTGNSSTEFDPASLPQTAAKLVNTYDWQYGGWGRPPKFPQPMALEFLLRRHLRGEAYLLEPVRHCLHAMAQGGMYDVVGGGFARYSTDANWTVPHFEKMLYDNALLARVYLHAGQVTGEPFFRRIAGETLDFVVRELTSPEGGFYSSLDADSEGMEGKYYTWTLEEIRAILGDRSGFFEIAYGLTAQGNWEGRIVLHRAVDDATLAARHGISTEEAILELEASHAKLREARNARVRPATDDKILTSWNGLMLATFAEAARVLAKPRYLEAAQKNAAFIINNLRPDGRLHRAWRKGRAGNEVFLDDYAALTLGLLSMYETDFDNYWYTSACKLADEMLRLFADPSGGFFDTPEGAEAIIIRPRDLQDNAVPSGNALTAEALLRLVAFSGEEDWRGKAEATLSLVSSYAPRYPLAFARWLSAADFAFSRAKQAALVGDPASLEMQAMIQVLRENYRPNLIAAASTLPLPAGAPPLLEDRPMVGNRPTAYVCEGFTCRLPVTSPEALEEQLKDPK